MTTPSNGPPPGLPAYTYPEVTLGQMRNRLVVRLGFSAMVEAPGMLELLNDFIQDAQKQLYDRESRLRSTKWWSITTVENERFYHVPVVDGENLDFTRIKQVMLQDGEQYIPMYEGIPHLHHNITGSTWPTNYELREYFEIFPDPRAGFTIWIKGDRGLLTLTDDADLITIDPEPVFLMSLANAKAHYGQPDSGAYFGQLNTYVGKLNAQKFGNKRYLPSPNRYHGDMVSYPFPRHDFDEGGP